MFTSTQDKHAEPPSRRRFIIGQDREGHWLALDTKGRSGGIFASQGAALYYAIFESDHRPGAVQIARQPLELPL